jgi:hypothetical protein
VTNRGNDLQSLTNEADEAIRKYELSRDRYMQTIRADAEDKVVQSVSKRRQKLIEEIDNLRNLAKLRADQRTEAVKAYAQRCPTRVSATSLLPPGPTDRVGNFGVDKLFKTAVKAAEDFNEVNEILRKRRESLELIDSEMRDVLQKHNDDLIAFLETPDGLANAFKRDPLLAQAHARMKAAIAQRDAMRAQTAMAPPESAAT